MPIKVNVDVSNLMRRFEKFAQKLDTLPWFKVGTMAQNSIVDNFIQQGRPKKWAPRKQTYSHPPLDKTGKMKSSIDQKPIPNGVSVGTRGIFYAGFQQKGTKKMVARPFVMVQPDDVKEIKKVISNHLKV